MSERTAYLKGVNLGILLASAFAAALGSGLLLGPVRARLDQLHAELGAAQEQFVAWQASYARFRPIPSDTRATWRTNWLSLEERLRSAHGDAELLALVAAGLQTESVRGLQVSRRPNESMSAPEDAAEALLLMPLGDGEPLLARPEAVRATLTVDYADARRILERLETHRLPARLDAIEMKRDFPAIWMQLDLVYFVRAESER